MTKALRFVTLAFLLRPTPIALSAATGPLQEDIGPCAQELGRLAGLGDESITHLTQVISKAAPSSESEFRRWLVAIGYVESRFRSAAHSPADARGTWQLTEVGAAEGADECNLPILPSWSLHTLHRDEVNLRYASCLLRRYVTQTRGNWAAALTLYNGGYLQLRRYEAGRGMAEETRNYVLAVFYAKGMCDGAYSLGGK